MARSTNKLSAKGVEAAKEAGMYADGAGLYLRVKSATAKSWVFVWHVPGVDSKGSPVSKRREMGLGSTLGVSLARARELAMKAREEVADGRDPSELRQAAAAVPTFGDMADEFIFAILSAGGLWLAIQNLRAMKALRSFGWTQEPRRYGPAPNQAEPTQGDLWR